jgi:Na+-driven multidrug efflux pump
MSQLPQQGPSPYSPLPPQQPGYYYGTDPYDELLAPARRASTLMYVLGAFFVLSAFACGGFVFSVPWSDVVAQQPEFFAQHPSMTPELARIQLLIIAAVSVIIGIVFLVVAYTTRSGGMGAIITGIALASLAVIVLLISIIGTIAQLQGESAGNLLCGLVVLMVPLLLFGLMLGWLIQAARNAPRVQSMQAQYQLQYWQYQQQQRAYQEQPQEKPQQQQQQPPPQPQTAQPTQTRAQGPAKQPPPRQRPPASR